MWKHAYEITSNATLTLPALEVTLLVAILAICLVFKFSRVGLIVAYLFVYRWGWLFFAGQSSEMLMGYLIFGCLAGILTVVGLLRHPE